MMKTCRVAKNGENIMRDMDELQYWETILFVYSFFLELISSIILCRR